MKPGLVKTALMLFALSVHTTSTVDVRVSGSTSTVKLPVQLGFTLYVPEYVSSRELPATTRVWVPLTFPCPSKVILPTAATGKNVVAEDATNPLVVYPYVPATLL